MSVEYEVIGSFAPDDEKNGIEQAVVARVSRPMLKVLFITGFAENAVLSHGHLDPGMYVLTKPFAMEALANRLKDLIESR